MMKNGVWGASEKKQTNVGVKEKTEDLKNNS